MVVKPTELDGGDAMTEAQVAEVLAKWEEYIDQVLRVNYGSPEHHVEVRIDHLPSLDIKGERSEKMFRAVVERYREAGWNVSLSMGYSKATLRFGGGGSF